MSIFIPGGTVVPGAGADPAEVLIDSETVTAALQASHSLI